MSIRPLLLVASVLLCAQVAHGGTHQTVAFKSGAGAGVQGAPGLSFAGAPDLQNYCSSWNPAADSVPPAADRADGIRQLRLMVEDIIAERPPFVIQVGDIADTMGGSDQSTTAGYLDDPNNFTSNFPRFNGELQCVLDHFFKPLEAAGIPVFWVAGNHDSCVDLERVLPLSAFQAKSYYHAAQNRAARCDAGLPDTMQRAALFTTSIGPLCVVGARYRGAEQDATDIAWVNSTIGCGAGHPTIIVQHDGIGASTDYSGAGNSEVFANLYGHATPLGMALVLATAAGGHQFVQAGLNWQESSRDCQGWPDIHDPGDAMHTGVGFWVMYRINPAASTITATSRSPVLGGSQTVRNGCTYNNTPGRLARTFSPSLCTRFPSMTGC